MARIWGPGGWVGPGSRLEDRTYLRWFRFLVGVVLGWLASFLSGYFGWTNYRTEHEVLPSLLRGGIGGVLLGLGMTALFEWSDRSANRE